MASRRSSGVLLGAETETWSRLAPARVTCSTTGSGVAVGVSSRRGERRRGGSGRRRRGDARPVERPDTLGRRGDYTDESRAHPEERVVLPLREARLSRRHGDGRAPGRQLRADPEPHPDAAGDRPGHRHGAAAGEGARRHAVRTAARAEVRSPRFPDGRARGDEPPVQGVRRRGRLRQRALWDSTIVRDGKPLTWESAKGLFVDRSGQPGPSSWEGGAPPRVRRSPRRRRELVRGARVRALRPQGAADGARSGTPRPSRTRHAGSCRTVGTTRAVRCAAATSAV